MKRFCATLILDVALLGVYGLACSVLSLGELPLELSSISGTVAGNAKYADASKPRRRLSGVRVQLLGRTDKKYSKDVFAKKFRSSVRPGMIAQWTCTNVVATASSDSSGNFVLPAVAPGKYCLHFEGAEIDSRNHIRIGQVFLVNIDPAAKYQRVTADITPLWPDCKGGGKIVYAGETGPEKKLD